MRIFYLDLDLIWSRCCMWRVGDDDDEGRLGVVRTSHSPTKGFGAEVARVARLHTQPSATECHLVFDTQRHWLLLVCSTRTVCRQIVFWGRYYGPCRFTLISKTLQGTKTGFQMPRRVDANTGQSACDGLFSSYNSQQPSKCHAFDQPVAFGSSDMGCSRGFADMHAVYECLPLSSPSSRAT